jgi:hypothetical protein
MFISSDIYNPVRSFMYTYVLSLETTVQIQIMAFSAMTSCILVCGY